MAPRKKDKKKGIKESNAAADVGGDDIPAEIKIKNETHPIVAIP
jgi:hypothetical protein